MDSLTHPPVERAPDIHPDSLDLVNAFEEVLPVLHRFLDFQGAALFVAEPSGLRAASGYRLPHFRYLTRSRLPLDHPLVVEMAKTGRALVIPDIDAEPRFIKAHPQVTVRSWIGVPVFLGEELAGLLSISHSRPNRFYPRDGELAQALARQVAISVEKERLFRAEQRRRLEAEVLRDATTALTLDLEPEEILVELLRRLRRVVPFDSAGVLLLEGERLRVVAALDLPRPEEAVGRTFPADNPLFRTIQVTGRALYCPDVQTTGGFEGWGGTEGIHSWLGVPMRHRGQIIGYITLDHRAVNAYREQDVELAQAFANQVTATVVNARLFQQVRRAAEENRRRVDELTVLDRLQTALRNTVTVQQVLEASLSCLDIFQGQHASIAMPDPDGALQVVHQLGPVQAVDLPPMPPERSLIGRVYTTGEPYLTNDALSESRAAPEALAAWRRRGFQHVRAMFAPLRTGEEIVGVMTLMAVEATRRYTDQDLRLFVAMAEIIGSALARAQLLETLEERVAERTRALQAAYERLQELDRLKSQFVANVSHELRTPLANIKFYLDLVARGDPARRDHYLATLHREVDHLHRLVESVLDLSRLEEARDRGELHTQAVDLVELTQVVLTRMEPLAQMRQVTLQAVTPTSPVWVEGDATYLAQVLSNLVDNAIRYNRPGGQVVLRVAQSSPAEAQIQVEDTGIGIPATDLPHIFERFYRGTQVGEGTEPGTGLGLNIVQEIVSVHGGRIEVESEPERGSRFTVYLPLQTSCQSESTQGGTP